MKNSDSYLINSSALEELMIKGKFKQWWVAEQIHVDRRTLVRWVNGQVKFIKKENLDNLAKCLGCKNTDLVLESERYDLPSVADQNEAQRLIENNNLVEVFRHSNHWDLLNSILNALISKQLPLPLLGKLYNLLAMAANKRNDFVHALDFAEKALAIGLKTANKIISVDAQFNIAVNLAFRGNIDELQDKLAACRDVYSELGDIEKVGMCFGVMGYYSYLAGNWNISLENFEEALRIFAAEKLVRNLAITHFNMGLVEHDRQNYEVANSHLQSAQKFAENCGYIPVVCQSLLYQALLLAYAGNLKEARIKAAEGTQRLEGVQFNDYSHIDFAKAKLMILEGEYENAKDFIEQSLKSVVNPLMQGRFSKLLREIADK